MITFTKQPQLAIESAYNNQVFEFVGDENKRAVRAIVTLFFNPTTSGGGDFQSNQTLNFEIAANNGTFYFNGKRGIKNLFNKDNFSDGIIPTNINFLIQDPKLFCRIGYKFEVVYNNNTRDIEQIEKSYFKSVRNFFNDQQNNQPSGLRLLSPTNYFNYFEGLPFDISFYTPTAGPVTIRNENNGIETTKSFFAGVNRLFLSNGEPYNLGFENEVPLLNNRVNTLVFENSQGQQLGIVKIKKVPSCKAPFLKWFNEFGSWNYWRFQSAYQGDVNHRNKQFLNNDFQNFEEDLGNFQATGKTAARTFDLYTDALNDDELKYFKSLFISPKIFLYSEQEFTPIGPASFKEVSLSDGTNRDVNTKIRNREFDISVELPIVNTQTYEN